MKIRESCLWVGEYLPLHLGRHNVKEDQGNEFETQSFQLVDGESVRDSCATVVADKYELSWGFGLGWDAED